MIQCSDISAESHVVFPFCQPVCRTAAPCVKEWDKGNQRGVQLHFVPLIWPKSLFCSQKKQIKGEIGLYRQVIIPLSFCQNLYYHICLAAHSEVLLRGIESVIE